MRDHTLNANRRAKQVLDARALHTLLDLPEGSTITAVEAHNDPLRVVVIFHHDHLDPVPPDAEAPIFRPPSTACISVNCNHTARDFLATNPDHPHSDAIRTFLRTILDQRKDKPAPAEPEGHNQCADEGPLDTDSAS